jgi:hypothetical protein
MLLENQRDELESENLGQTELIVDLIDTEKSTV